MKIGLLAVSALALGLYATSALSQDQPADAPAEPPAAEQPAVEQPAAEQPAPEQPAASQVEPEQPAALPEEVMQLLADTRAPSELSPEELQQRAALARKFSRTKGISEDVRGQLASIAKAARAELMAREQQAQPAPPKEEPVQKAEEPAPAQPPAAVQKAAPAEPNATSPLPRALVSLLADERPASALSDEELAKRMKRISQFQNLPDLDPKVGGKLQALLADAESEQARRQQAASQPAPAVPEQPPVAAEQPPAQPQPPVVVEQPSQKARPPVAEVPAQPPIPPPVPPQPPVAEVPAQPQQPVQPPAPVQADAKDTQRLDSNVANPEAEAQAQKFLNDPRPAKRLSDDQLRQRLDGIRDLMAGNELSRETERALRQKLTAERDILRQRVAAAEAAAQQEAEEKQGRQKSKRPRWGEEPPADWRWSDRQALNDRRASEELRDYELRRRLEIYRRATADRRYEQAYRDYWRAVIERDQYVLQQRLIEARRARQAEIDTDEEPEFDINIGIGRRPQQEDVFAAEVDDQELADVLAAEPRRKFKRRFTVEEIEQQPEVRAALPRIELDTIRFGFNEAFVRPEEIDKLDRIGEIIEQIVRKRPNEVFLIEGHTDAVGSDAANLALSRKRAEAVKKALTGYYLIPTNAIRTVGYGERYLKIPTADPEAENRRVSVSRATDVIGTR